MAVFNLAIERADQDNTPTGFEKPKDSRQRQVKVSNVPTDNGRYVFMGVLKSAYSPRYMQDIVKSKGVSLMPLVLQVYSDTLYGGDRRLTTIYDPDPDNANKRDEGLWIQHVMFVEPEHLVLKDDKDNMVDKAVAFYGHHKKARTYFNLQFNQPLMIYANHQLVVRYSIKGFPYRRLGNGGRLWFGTENGYLIDSRMLEKCLAEMSGR